MLPVTLSQAGLHPIYYRGGTEGCVDFGFCWLYVYMVYLSAVTLPESNHLIAT